VKLLLVACVCLVAAVPIFLQLGRVPFDDPGEGMHAEIARELSANGGVFALRFNGVRYVDKPPLLYWLIAGAMRLFGATEAGARSVPAVAGLAAIAATAWLGAELLGRRAAIAAGLALLTCVWFFAFARYVRPETLFVAALAWGFALALTGIRSGRRGRVIGGLAAFGAAALAKDPLGAVGPMLVIGVAMALTGGVRPVARWLPAAGVLACVLLAFGWYPILEAETPGFVWYTIVDNHVLNVLGARHFPDEDVPLGLVAFLSAGALGAAPWTLAAAVSVGEVIRRRAWRHPEELPWVVLAVWAVGVFAMTAASSFRLPHYGLPAYPAIVLLAVRAWLGPRGRLLAAIHAAMFALFALGCWIEIARGGEDFIDHVIGMTDVYTRKEGAAGEVSPLPPWELFRPLVVMTAVIFSIAAAALAAVAARAALGSGLFLTLGAMAALLPVVATAQGLTARHRAVRGMALEIAQRVQPGERLLHEGPIENSGALEFYSGLRPIIVEGRRSVLAFGATFPEAREIFWDAERLRREWGDGRLYLVTTRRPEQSLVATLPRDRVRLLASTGGRRLYLNEAPGPATER
jgi:4-amino-4-deoxy-L-arabinose transferase-like glycosyltransferase